MTMAHIIGRRRWISLLLNILLVIICILPRANSFATPSPSLIPHYQVDNILPHNKYNNGRIKHNSYISRRRKQTFQLYDTTIIPAAKSVIEQAAAASQGVVLADYQSDAAALFNNMKVSFFVFPV